MRAQAKGTPEDFQELPKEAPPPTAAPEEIAAPEEAPGGIEQEEAQNYAHQQADLTKGRFAKEPEEAPETNPPPQTPQTLAERRQADLDAKMAAKVRGEAPEPATGTPAPKGSARQRTAEALGNLMGRAAKRMNMEGHGQDILDNLEENGTKVNDVAKKFWSDTYFKLPAEVQARFRGELENHTGMKKGSMTDVADTVKNRMDLPDDPTHLEGTDRGFVALMDEANRRVAGQGEAPEPVTGTPAPAEGPAAVEPPPNRLAAIRAAAEKRQGAAGFTPSTDEQLAGYAEKAAAKRKGGEPSEPMSGSDKPENSWFTDKEGQRTAAAVDKPRMVKDAVQKAIQPQIDRLGVGQRTTVHDSQNADTVPQHLKNQMVPGKKYSGVYDPITNTIHIFADGHASPEAAHQTMNHETVGHFGSRALLGDDFSDTMRDIFKNASAKGKAWMKDYAEQHQLDGTNPRHQQTIGDEYNAHLAENPAEDPGLLKRIRDAWRAGLHYVARKAGFNMEWTDADIHALIRRSTSRLEELVPSVREKQMDRGAVFSDAKSPDPNVLPTDPEAIAHKFGRTMEEQASGGPATLQSRGDWLRQVGGAVKDALTRGDVKTMSSRLAFLHLDSLPDIVRAMKTPREFVRTVQQMTGRAGRMMDEGNALALKWSRWANGGIFKDPDGRGFTMRKGQADGGKAMHDLMHSTTIAGQDPSREFQAPFKGDALTPEQGQANRSAKAFHTEAKKIYDGMDPEGREIYNKVRDYYQDRRADVMRGLEQRISETGADEKTKQQLMAQLRQTFERGQVKGPYFPLARFGDHWARATDPATGEHAFSRFEDPVQRKRWLERAKAAGLDTDQGTKNSDRSLMERVDPDFVKKVMTATEGHKDLQDEIWQHYLQAMPEMSMRKNLIHRKNILGYSENALRAFAYNAFHSAHQIARLEYGNRLDTINDRMEQEANGISSTQPDSNNAHWAPAVSGEFRRRLDWIKNPRASAMASGATKLGYNWFIGASPATAIRISTQNAMLAEPYLGAKASRWGLGYNAGRAELWKAVGLWAKTSMNPLGKSNFGDALRGKERDMFDELRARGTFSSTSSQTLASGGADRPIGIGKLDAFNRVSSFMFNAMEHKNRQTTALAAYRLAVRSGMGHEEATEEANDASNKAHFNYNNYNRPRVLQNDFAKVAGLFKQYPWQVTDRLARSFRDGVLRNSELSVEDRNEQLKAFAGYMGKMMLFAGIKGVPILYHATMAAINNVFGNKDQPFDAQAALREHMEQSIGKTASDAVMDGPMSAITGAALSNGASYADLWYKQPARDMTWGQQAGDLLGQIAGPVYGSIPEMGVGADIIHGGNLERGLEHMLPPAVNHLMKAQRAASEGYTNLRGEQVVSPEELGQGWSTGLVGLGAVRQKNILLQALGFQPEVYARQGEQNTSEQNFKTEITQRQQFLTEQYDNAVGRGDNDEAIKWMEQMQQFHQANPSLPWSAKGMINSMRSNEKNTATAEHGVNMAPGMRAEYRQMTGGQ